METIYQVKYWTDTLDESNELLAKNEPDLQAAIAKNPFFSAYPAESCDDFSELARLCHQFAAHENAEIEVAIDEDEHTAKIQLTAPCFYLQCRQLILLNKISVLVSDLTFDVTEELTSQLTVSFDFPKANEIIYRQLHDRFFKE